MLWNRKYFNLLLILFGFLTSIMIINFLIPNSEIMSFFDNTASIIKLKPFLDSYIYPTPIISGDTIATKGIIFVLIGGLISLLVLMKKNSNQSNEFSLFLIACVFVSILVYKNGLGRSDAAHIKYSLGFNHFLITTCFLNLFLTKTNFNINNLRLIITSLVALNIFTILIYNKDNASLKNLINYNNKVKDYVAKEDKFFLKIEAHEVLDYYKVLAQGQDCALSFTNEPAWVYLLKTKNCSKYYVNWFAATDKLQREYIKILKEKKIKYILFDSKNKLLPDGFKNKERHKIIYKYLIKNYSKDKDVNGWVFYKKIM